MNDMPQNRYTRSQVLCGLHDVWQQRIGSKEPPFNADTGIHAYMAADGSWEELDLAGVFAEIEDFFGFHCSREEWEELFGFDSQKYSYEQWQVEFAPRLTFGVLADFIAEQSPKGASFQPVSFEPITVLGKACLPAGVFTGIMRIAERTSGQSIRFAPSDRIIDTLQGNSLDAFWSRLRWIAEDAIPELPKRWRKADRTCGCLGGMLAAVSFVGAAATGSIGLIPPALLTAVALVFAGAAYKRFADPLPKDVETFRDLSMLIAESRA